MSDGAAPTRRTLPQSLVTPRPGAPAAVGENDPMPASRPRPLPGADFLSVPGEMAARMRAFDWSAHPLGPPDGWPQSLKVAVRILLTSRYAMWIGWGPEFTFFYNDAYRPTLGVKHEWALGMPARELWSEIWADVGPRAESVLRTGEATWDEGLLLFLERSGFPEETYHTFSYSPLPDDAGGVGGMLCVVTEESQRVVGERRLRSLRELASDLTAVRTEREVAAALEGRLGEVRKDVPFALLYLFEEDGRARLAAARGVLRGSPAAPLEMPLSGASPWPVERALSASDAPVLVDLDERFGELPGVWGQRPRRAAIVPLAQQGQERAAGCLIAGVSPVRPWDAAYAGFLSLFAGQVASALANARAHEEERRRTEALAELDRAKTAFFSNVSHEFRTPLTLMLGPLEEVLARENGELPPGVREELTLARRNGMRLRRLVNTLLDFSRIEAGRTQAEFEPTDLAACTAELASVFRSAAERGGLRLVVDCPALPEPVYVDRGMWEKVVLNLLSNAFKHTFEGEIRVRLRAAGGAAELTVEDTGTGIPEPALPRIFERFFRVEGARSRTHEGSGIGLAFVQELVKLHGGTIGVRSREGEGSAFTVAIPFGSAHLPQDRLRPEGAGERAHAEAVAFIEETLRWMPEPEPGNGPGSGAEPAGVGAEEASGAANARPRILVVDDSADMRGYVRRLLAGQYRVETAADGREALEAVRRDPPDLVLTDVMMPGVDGFALLAALREDAATRALPVILLSARAGEDARVEGLRAGADDYMVKPFSARELQARVGATLALARLRRENRAALEEGASRYRQLVHGLHAAVYTCDADGRISLYNRAAVELWGREPRAGVDSWCGSHRIYQMDGTPVRHDACRMADAVREGRATRGVEALIERPDGTRRAVLAYPEPIRDDRGRVVGAVNLLVDVTDRKIAEEALRRSEAFARSVIENSPDSLKLLDLDGRILWMSEQGQRLLELPDFDAVRGADWRTLWPAEETQRLADEAVAAAKAGGVGRFQGQRPTAAGALKWWDVAVAAIHGPDGKPERLLAGSRDVTEMRRIEEALRESEQRVRLATEATELGTWDHDMVGDRMHWDERCRRMFGLSPEAPLDYGVFIDAVHPEDRARVEAAVLAATDPDGPGLYGVEYRTVRVEDGVQRWVRTTGRAFFEGRRPTRLIGTIQDVTERKLVEHELEMHRQNLERLVEQRTAEFEESHQRLRLSERMALLGTLAAGLGHDMGNLLVPVRVRVEALERAGLPPELCEHVQGIRTSADYLQRLANGLRLLALNPDRGAAGEATDILEWWQDAEPVLRNALPRGMRLEARLPEGPCRASVPRPALTQAIFNLVQNAGDAMRARGHGEVKIFAERRGDGVRIGVVDDGPGMPPEVRARCMEPFFTTKPRGISTGLGLVLVYSLVRDAGGTIELHSEPGRGTEFVLTLPAAEDAGVRASARRARVRLRDARLRAFVIAQLRSLGCAEANGEETPDILVTDVRPEGRAGSRVVFFGEGAPEGAAELGPRPKPQAIREALAWAVGTGAGRAGKMEEMGTAEAESKRTGGVAS